MSKKVSIEGKVEVPFSCDIELNDEDLELLLNSPSCIRVNGSTDMRYLFSLLYDKIIINEDEFSEIDIDWIEDEKGNLLN